MIILKLRDLLPVYKSGLLSVFLAMFVIGNAGCENSLQSSLSKNRATSFVVSQAVSHISYLVHNMVHLGLNDGDILLGHNLSSNRKKFWRIHNGIYFPKSILSSPPGAGVAIVEPPHDEVILNKPKNPSRKKFEESLTLSLGPISGALTHWILLRGLLGKKASNRAKMHALIHLADLAITLPADSSGNYPKIFGTQIKTDGSQILEKLNLKGPKKYAAHILPIIAWSVAVYFMLIHNRSKQSLKELGIDFITDSIIPTLINAAYTRW